MMGEIENEKSHIIPAIRNRKPNPAEILSVSSVTSGWVELMIAIVIHPPISFTMLSGIDHDKVVSQKTEKT
ncbi:hypothetical protein hrd7_26060 [Leptolinea sp. HRD-7]|nr:hypothetical protein hrd7_26060 [Leptolinea sp. HRD-7]